MISDLMHQVGLVGYAGIVALAVVWSGIGLSYLKSGRAPTIWVPFVVSMLSFAVLFFGLTMVATNATWFAGDARAYMIRGASALAAISGIAYTVGMLREEWKISNVSSGGNGL